MLVKINDVPIIDEQEKLFQDVKESFERLIVAYRKKHWFKDLIYEFTDGEDLINIDRIKSRLWYWKLVLSLRALRILLAISPPSKEQAEEMIEVLETLKEKLEVD